MRSDPDAGRFDRSEWPRHDEEQSHEFDKSTGVVITFAALALAAPLASGVTFQASYSSNTSGNDIINSRLRISLRPGTRGFRAFVMPRPRGPGCLVQAYQNPGFLSRGYWSSNHRPTTTRSFPAPPASRPSQTSFAS